MVHLKSQNHFSPHTLSDSFFSYLCTHRALKDNPSMLELVLPDSLSREELVCADDVATELGLRTEKV